MKALVLLVALLVAVSCVYTSSYYRKRGRLIDGKLHYNFKNITDVLTQCNVVNLNQTPYDYDGIVRSGYLNLKNKGSSALAFIFYGKEKANMDEIGRTPTIIWLNGGPGSSSQIGNLMELGPFWLVLDTAQPYRVIRNNNSWVKDYNVLFVDQPIGTGLSYADPRIPNPYVHSMDDVAEDFYNALYTLYNDAKGCFNNLNIKPDATLFIFGESYAGKYVPAIGAKIVKEKLNGGFLKGLKGIGIGDGFTHPFNILAEVGNFAFNLGLLDYQDRTKIEQMIINATFQERERNWKELHNSFDNVLDSIVEMAGGVNVYDLTKYHDYPDEIIGEYFGDPEVIKLFSLNPDIQFGSQSDNVYDQLYDDFMKPYVDRVEYLLQQNLPVLIYNGQNDIIVETPGTMRWVQRINYADAQAFRNTKFRAWNVDGQMVGSVKSAGNLEFRIVNNAGHLVPMDQGRNALEMVRSFVNRLKEQQKQQQKMI